jgi:hypothetical protein
MAFQPNPGGGSDAFVSQVSDCACTPQNLALAGTASHEIDLTWQDYCPDFTLYFELNWHADDGSNGVISPIPAGQLHYEHMGLNSNTIYHYQILANNGCCPSGFSNEVDAMPGA